MVEDAAPLLSRAREAGVHRFLVPGTTLADSESAVRMAGEHDDIWAAVGIHPHEAKDFDPRRDGTSLERLARQPRVAGIGEIGLDFTTISRRARNRSRSSSGCSIWRRGFRFR
jgi:TatD DNase family protein